MISIIIPVYKVEKYLRRCLDSVLAQTYTDLEIILVDDGSPDGSGSICDEYAEKDSRIKVIHQANAGAAAARNAGVAAATGEFTAFVDSDDYIDPTMYEQLLDIIQVNDADIAECGYRWVKPDVTYDRENTGKVDVYTNLEALEMLYFGDQMFGGISIVVWNKLYRTDLVKAVSFLEGRMNEDCLYTPMILYRARKIAKLNLNLYNFFFSENSVSRSAYRLKNTDAVEIYDKLMRFFESVELERYFLFAQNSYLNVLYHNYFECYKRRQQPDFKEKADQFRQELTHQYEAILANPHQQNNQLRHRIFHTSPLVWYWCMSAVRWIKRLREK